MSSFGDLPSNERKKIIDEKLDYLKQNLSPDEYEKLQKELDACTIKFDPTIAGMTHDELMKARPELQTKAYKRQKRKEEKEWERQLKDKPEFLMFLARFFHKIIHFLHFIYTLCGVSTLYYAWKIYQLCSVAGWHGIFQTKYTLYIVVYFAIWFIVSKLNFKLFLYGNDEI